MIMFLTPLPPEAIDPPPSWISKGKDPLQPEYANV